MALHPRDDGPRLGGHLVQQSTRTHVNHTQGDHFGTNLSRQTVCYRGVRCHILGRGHMVVGGEFGHHALVLGVPQSAVQVGEVLKDVVAVLRVVARLPAAELGTLRRNGGR